MKNAKLTIRVGCVANCWNKIYLPILKPAMEQASERLGFTIEIEPFFAEKLRHYGVIMLVGVTTTAPLTKCSIEVDYDELKSLATSKAQELIASALTEAVNGLAMQAAAA